MAKIYMMGINDNDDKTDARTDRQEDRYRYSDYCKRIRLKNR